MFALILALVFALSMTACGGSRQETAAPEQDAETEEVTDADAPAGSEEDGIGEDPSFGEGIGEVVALTPDEESYMLAQMESLSSRIEVSQFKLSPDDFSQVYWRMLNLRPEYFYVDGAYSY